MKPYYDHAGITIYHGDCREVMPQIEDESVGLSLTDPPYGVMLDYRTDTFVDTFGNWCALVVDLMPHLRRVTDGAVVIPTSKIEGERFMWTMFPPDWRICWYKGATDTRCGIGWKDWETLFVYGKPRGMVHDFLHVQPNAARAEMPGHPCPKPLAWATWIIKRMSKEGDTILDPTCGSGTALRAAKDLGRKAIGIETEERYCEIAANRLAQEVLPFAS